MFGRPGGGIAALSLAAIALTGTPARANGRYPIAGQIAVSPSQPGLLALRATFGILQSRDGGRVWNWICEPAVGYSDLNEDPSIGWTETSAVVGMFEGLAVSTDEGCSWATKIVNPIRDLVVRRDDPHAALALTTAYQATDDAGDLLYASTLYATEDDGAHWAAWGTMLDPLLIPETVDVSADGTTVYVSGYTFLTGNQRQGVFLRSTDGGMNYVRSSIELGPMELAPFIGAIDPSNPLRVYVRVSANISDVTLPGGPNPDRLLVSDDGGQSFRTVLTSAGPLLGFALSPDGSKVYAGGPNDGVQVAPSATLSFVKKASLPVYCLATTGKALLACSDEAVSFFVGTSADDGATFSTLLHRSCVRGALACPATSSAAQCVPLFENLAMQGVGNGGPICGNSADASSPADGSTGRDTGASGGHTACNCHAAAGDGSRLGAWSALAGAAILARRRHSRASVRGAAPRA